MKNVKRISFLLMVCMIVTLAMPSSAFADFSSKDVTSKDGNWTYFPDYGKKTCKLTSWKGASATLAIPSSVDGLKVVEADLNMWDRRKANADMITAISIAPTVKVLRKGCFEELKNLKSATIPDTVTTIEYGLFKNCESLKEFTMPKRFKSVPMDMFSGCTSLEKVKLHSGITSIGESAFYGCTSLKSIAIPSKVNEIGNYAFYESGLTSVSMPSGVKELGFGVFYGCESLTEAKLPKYLKEIKAKAFYDAAALKYIEIPSSCAKIGSSAFVGCENLTTVVCKGNTDIPTYKSPFEASALLTIYGPSTSSMKNVPNYCSETGIAFKSLNPPVISSKKRTASTAALKWKRVPEAVGYKVYKKVGSGSYKLVKTTTGISYKNTGLRKGTTYRYYVTTLKKDALGNTIESRGSSVYKTYLKK